MKFSVETDDLLLALKAVLPHASPVKDDRLNHRVRLTVDPHNVTVTATNRSTAGLAIASLWDSEDGEVGIIDLTPQDVSEVLTVFKARRRPKDDDGSDATLSIDVVGEQLILTDVSGLFPGKSLTLPRYSVDDQFLDVARLLAGLRTLDPGTTSEQLTFTGHYVSLFARAAAVYKQPLIFDLPSHPAGSLLVSCGESFLGLLIQRRRDEDDDAQIKAWREAWTERIGHLADEATS